MIKIDTRGFDLLDKRLQQLEPRVQKRVLQKAVTSGIRKGRLAIKNAAPRGQGQSSVQKKYGYKHLHQELKVKRLKRTAANEKASRVDTGRAFWALFYELGSRHQPARPFMANAFKNATPEMLRQMFKVLKKGIEKEATR